MGSETHDRRRQRGRSSSSLSPLWLVASLVLLASGAVVIGARPGLETQIFALTQAWEGEPVHSQVSYPALRRDKPLARYLHTHKTFSVRWRGWLVVEEGGDYRFRLRSDERSYLTIDGRLVVDRTGLFGEERPRARIALEAGVHPIEIGYSQSRGGVYLRALWTPPGGSERLIDPDSLFASRPGALRRWLRRAPIVRAPLGLRLTGVALLWAGLALLPAGVKPLGRRLYGLGNAARRWIERPRPRRIADAAFLAGLGGVSFGVFVRAAGSPVGYDDVRYLDVAYFGKQLGWMFDRYAHVYLLRLFQFLEGDPFRGAEIYWGFLMAVTVVALAVAVRSLGPGLGVPTLTATLLLLGGQRVLFDTAGSMWSDYSTMMFVTVAVAVYLHHLAAPGDRRHEIHALLIGALSLAAVRSKVTGAIVLWLLLLLLFHDGRIDLRRFARRLGYWLAGLVAAQLLMMAVDGWVGGDVWFSLRSTHYESIREVHLPDEPEVEVEELRFGWLDQVWPRSIRGRVWIPPFIALAPLVLAGGFGAALTRQRIELRLLHLMPLAYLGALIVLQAKEAYGVIPRHLFPIVPVAALTGGALFRYAGLDRLSLRRLASPRILLPAAAALLLLLLVVIPGVSGSFSEVAAPREELAMPPAGSPPEAVVRAVLLPAAVLLLLTAAPLLARHPTGRPLLLLAALVLLTGVEARNTALLLSSRRAQQRSQFILYPWQVLAGQIRPGTRLTVSPELVDDAGMFGPGRTAERVARLYFRDPRLTVDVTPALVPTAEYALGTELDLRRWRRRLPGLGSAATSDPLARLTMVHPREAWEKQTAGDSGGGRLRSASAPGAGGGP